MNNFPKFWIVAFAGASLSIGISSHFHYGNVQENGILTFLGVFLVYNHYLLTENKRPILIRTAMLVLLLITLGLAIHIASTFVSFLILVMLGFLDISFLYFNNLLVLVNPLIDRVRLLFALERFNVDISTSFRSKALVNSCLINTELVNKNLF